MLVGRSDSKETGAIALLFAMLTAAVLFAVAALAIDIGNEVTRNTDAQRQADFSALAGGAQLTDSVGSADIGKTPANSVLTAVMTYLNDNQPENDGQSCVQTDTCIASIAQLTDGNLSNGEARYAKVGNRYGLQVITPTAHVAFGFANAFGVAGTNVQATATVGAFSIAPHVLPMYAVTSCSWGTQTLSDPANGQVPSTTPNLAYNSQSNATTLQSATIQDNSGTTISDIPRNSAGNVLTLTAKKWSNTAQIGFFRGDDPDPAKVVSQNMFWAQSDASQTNISPYSDNQVATVRLQIPDTVAQTAAIWYVRVFDNASPTGAWSSVSEALPIRVGGAVLECASGSSDGNFGTLWLPRSDTQSANYLAMNIAAGLQAPLSLHVHPQYHSDSPQGQCINGVNGAIESTSSTDLQPQTNCVDTDTGLPANAATQGFVQGFPGTPGLLASAHTTSGCDPTGGSSDRPLTLNNVDYSINNDVLSCFLPSGVSIADITKDDANYTAGKGILATSILSSPRLVLVPVLDVTPTSGGSARYSLIGFRTGFITDEQSTSTAIKGNFTGSSDNGITVQGNDVKQIKIVFFNSQALPDDGKHFTNYLGCAIGDTCPPPIVHLID